MTIIPSIKFREPFSAGNSVLYVEMVNKFALNEEPDSSKATSATVIQNMMKEKKLAQFIRELKKFGITRFVPIKGIYLLQTIYKETPGIRGMGDVDLILDKKDYYKAISLFEKNSFPHFKYSPKRIFHHIRFYEYKVSVEKDLIELHHKLSVVNFFQIPWEKIGKTDFSTAKLYGEELLLPSLEEEFLISLVHSFFHKMPYHHLAELFVMFSNCDKKKVAELSEKWGTDHIYNLLLFLFYTALEGSSISPNDFVIKPYFRKIKQSKDREFPFVFAGLCWKKFFYRKSFLKWLLQQSLSFPLRRTLYFLNKKRY